MEVHKHKLAGVHRTEQTLDDLIDSKRRQLVQSRMQVPLLRDAVLQMRRDAAAMTKRYEQRPARDLARLALQLENEADERASMCREHEFERTVVIYLRMYHSHSHVQSQSQSSSKVHHSNVSNVSIQLLTTNDSTHAGVHESECAIDVETDRSVYINSSLDDDTLDAAGSSKCIQTHAQNAQQQQQQQEQGRVGAGSEQVASVFRDDRASKRKRESLSPTTSLLSCTVANALTTTKSKSQTIEAYVKHTDATNAHRMAIVEEYLTHIQASPPKIAMAVRDECVRCEGVKLLLCSFKSIMTCPECGYSVTYLDATSSSTSFDDLVEFSQYSYKRVNHFLMWLALVQGKEAHRVSDEILNSVMSDLYYRQHIVSTSDVTQKRVREALRRLRLRKAYDHVAQITARISGTRPPRISAEVEEQLKNMFLQMQPAFHKHTSKGRKNFLSYPYVLYRCFQILGLHHMLEGITLLKGRDKLEANDAIFRKMCETLGWHVSDLPPASETTAAF